MKKREFLKDICKLGVCSCAVSLINPEPLLALTDDDECKKAKEMNWRLEWRLNHAKRQFGTLLQKIEPELSPEIRKNMLEEMGRNCAKSLGWAEKYKNNPEGFFEHMFKHSGENITFDKDKKKITVVTRERDCDCPVINSAKTPAYYCDCSLGWQKEVYETILGKPVDVIIKESVLRGSKRCVFEVNIS
jgi:predicted hydrocarbon binding protein